ncbi:hypothetical protein JXB27_04725 [Candidatus Woesearchaeota archaeon]|nr:hypothetical protein [Candidatus Woesearchaeota archaeon]
MIKKDEKSGWKDYLEGLVKISVLGKIKEEMDFLVDKIHDAIVISQKKLIRGLFSSAIMVLGVVFLVISGSFFLTDVMKYSRTTVYLIAGTILVLISIILAQSARLLKYDFHKEKR